MSFLPLRNALIILATLCLWTVGCDCGTRSGNEVDAATPDPEAAVDGGRGNGDSGVPGDACAALIPSLTAADCANVAECPPVECECGGEVRTFGACWDDLCVSTVECDVLCQMTVQQIDNCARQVHRLDRCVDSMTCDGECAERFGVMVCVDQLPCLVDTQCTHYCGRDGKLFCALEAAAACPPDTDCPFGCLAGRCRSGAPGTPCSDSSQCEANFCVNGACSVGDPGQGCLADSNCRTTDCNDDQICEAVPFGGACPGGYEELCVTELCADNVCTSGLRGAPCAESWDCISSSCDEASGTCL